MNHEEHIKWVRDTCSLLLVEDNIEKVESMIDNLQEENKDFMNKLRAYKLVTSLLTWDAKVNIITWSREIGFDVDGEGFENTIHEFELDDIYVYIDVYIIPDWKGRLVINMKINDYEYDEEAEVWSKLDRRKVKRIVKKAKVSKEVPFVDFLIEHLNVVENHFEIE